VKPVTPLSPPPRDTRLKVQTDDPSPSARRLRLPFNGLATSELRRIFCSDEGAYVRQAHGKFFASCRSWRGPCPCIRRGETGGTSTPGATLQRRSYFQSPAHRFSAIKMRSFNDARQATVKPLSFPPRHLQAKTTHPSPSACKFRLLLNGLAASAPRQIFCSCRQLQEAMVNPKCKRFAEMGAHALWRGAPAQ
jgi:hypothetical protein